VGWREIAVAWISKNKFVCLFNMVRFYIATRLTPSRWETAMHSGAGLASFNP